MKPHKLCVNIRIRHGDEWVKPFFKELGQARLLSEYIRDGVRLIAELHEGRVDTLLQLFPNIEQQLADYRSRQNVQYISDLERQNVPYNFARDYPIVDELAKAALQTIAQVLIEKRARIVLPRENKPESEDTE